MKLDTKQRAVIIAGAVLFIGMGIIPPWLYTFDYNYIHLQNSAGYHVIFMPPDPAAEGSRNPLAVAKIDIPVLLLQWVVVAGMTGLGVFIAKPSASTSTSSGSPIPSAPSTAPVNANVETKAQEYTESKPPPSSPMMHPSSPANTRAGTIPAAADSTTAHGTNLQDASNNPILQVLHENLIRNLRVDPWGQVSRMIWLGLMESYDLAKRSLPPGTEVKIQDDPLGILAYNHTSLALRLGMITFGPEANLIWRAMLEAYDLGREGCREKNDDEGRKV